MVGSISLDVMTRQMHQWLAFAPSPRDTGMARSHETGMGTARTLPSILDINVLHVRHPEVKVGMLKLPEPSLAGPAQQLATASRAAFLGLWIFRSGSSGRASTSATAHFGSIAAAATYSSPRCER